MKLNIKISIILILLFALGLNCFSQRIEGKIIDSETKTNLSYVNIGVLNSTIGTITDENGLFELDCHGITENSKVRITMIGYKSETYSIKELQKENNQIELEKEVFELDEVIIEYKGTLRKIGTMKANPMAGVCGWGGTKFGKGHELGLEIDLGEKPVKIEDLNLKIHKQSFDTSMFRLHIRRIENDLPGKELLTENIFFNITGEKGWEKIDLSKYNVVTSGKVVLTIEWIKVSKAIEERLVKMNGSKQGTPVVLFKTNKKTGIFYIRKGSEAPWITEKENSPVFYIITKG
jgi:hypothetical protein